MSISEDEFERLRRQEVELRARIVGFSAADNLSREELHERGVDARPAVVQAPPDDE